MQAETKLKTVEGEQKRLNVAMEKPNVILRRRLRNLEKQLEKVNGGFFNIQLINNRFYEYMQKNAIIYNINWRHESQVFLHSIECMNTTVYR